MNPLYGNHEVTIDDKNRMLIPSEVRRSLDPATDGEAFFLLRGVNGHAWMYPERPFFALANKLQSELAPTEDVLAMDRWHFGTACRLEWDKQGRVVLPEKVVRKLKLGREVTIVGMRDHVEIWNRAEWDAEEDELERKQPEIAMQARLRQAEQKKAAAAAAETSRPTADKPPPAADRPPAATGA